MSHFPTALLLATGSFATLSASAADAPQISGRYATPSPQRVDTPESAMGISALSDKAGPRPTGTASRTTTNW
jgi:hypothetical protein